MTDDRGTASVEYLVVLAGVSLPLVAVLVVLGKALLRLHQWQCAWLGMPTF